MKMGEGVEWTLHCAALLAALPEGAVLPARALAEFHDVSESYLLKQLKGLTAAGLFVSTSGPKGGYRLARDPAQISLLELVLAVEGDQPAFRCAEIRRCGPLVSPTTVYSPLCPIHAAMQQAERAWRASLADISLADIFERVGDSIPSDVGARGKIWIQEHVRS